MMNWTKFRGGNANYKMGHRRRRALFPCMVFQKLGNPTVPVEVSDDVLSLLLQLHQLLHPNGVYYSTVYSQYRKLLLYFYSNRVCLNFSRRFIFPPSLLFLDVPVIFLVPFFISFPKAFPPFSNIIPLLYFPYNSKFKLFSSFSSPEVNMINKISFVNVNGINII